jgi:hypothetical protein
MGSSSSASAPAPSWGPPRRIARAAAESTNTTSATLMMTIASVPKWVAVTVRLAELPGRRAPCGVVSSRSSVVDPATAARTGIRTVTWLLPGTLMSCL